MILSFKKALQIAKKNKPDVVYGYEIFGALPGYVLSKLLRVPLILRFQGTILYPHLGKKSILPFFVHVVAFKIPADLIVITNDGTRGDLVAKYLRVPERRIRFWFNGLSNMSRQTIDSSLLKNKLALPSNAQIVMSICRLEDWKGVHRLIEAAPDVVEKRKGVFFVIVGDGSEKERLKDLANRLKVADHVIFADHVSHTDIFSYLSIADVYVTLQDLSCLSASLMDAMICGRCIVALNTGDTQKVLKNQKNGVLLEFSQLKLLPVVLLELLENDAYRVELGRKAKEYALRNFWTWDERANKEIRLVEELLVRANR
jgi:glycosyltransferase involved in cell wall biosynthesis